ncbi:hypothetical protein U9M48_039367 [Paspalum notatum var. saurae]|uniref:F-box domain-containing protein n=1 Tax=Paspalum notatum var. saurae TaxID=547442 RepID=A0AAQ3UQ49_PASNO
MSKMQRTEEPSSSSSGPRVCSSASARAPPRLPDVRGGEDPRPGSASEGGAQARVPDLGEDLVFELLMRAEARTLASAVCVSRRWRQLAREERLWIHPTHLHLDRQCPLLPSRGPVASWQAAHGGVERMPKLGVGGTTRCIPGDVLSPAGPPTMSSTGRTLSQGRTPGFLLCHKAASPVTLPGRRQSESAPLRPRDYRFLELEFRVFYAFLT